jgi:hypothetical protein
MLRGLQRRLDWGEIQCARGYCSLNNNGLTHIPNDSLPIG